MSASVDKVLNALISSFPKNSPVALDSGKYVALIEVLQKHGRLEGNPFAFIVCFCYIIKVSCLENKNVTWY